MYDRNVAITGSTIEKTARYDRFREDKIRMELYRVILALYGEGYRTFSCNLNTYIGLLAADTAIMLREADKCPDIHLSVIVTGIPSPADTDKVYCALYDDLAKKADVIMDGRDIGTCVLPDADVKVYLTASSAVRAKRRYHELKEKGTACDIDEIEKDIIERDYRDMHRENSPLKQADDAVLLDSSDMTLKEVVDTITAMIDKKQGA